MYSSYSTSHSLNSNNYSISSNRNRLQFIDCLKGSLESQSQRVRVRPEQRGGGRVHSGRVRRLLRRFHVVVPRRTGIKMDRKLPKMGENRLLSFLGTALYRVFLVYNHAHFVYSINAISSVHQLFKALMHSYSINY